MDQWVKNLYEASIEGNVERLNDLIKQDELIVERCTTITSYGETLLHIVAMFGHQDFCSELVRINPRLVLELDSRRSSALHLASARGHTNIVKTLVSVGPEMCLAYAGDGYNPVHLAAMKGRVDVLRELVQVCPDAVWARVKTCQGGNVLHLCVQYYQTEALKFLVELQNGQQLLNFIDSYGNSILHLAVGDKQVEIIQNLVSETSIEVNTLNSNGLTASDVLRLQPKRDSKYMEIAHFLQLSSGQTLSSLSSGHLSEINSNRLEGNQLQTENHVHVSLDKHRNSLMVVASLIATMAFQAGVNPPSGFKPNSQLCKEFVISNTTGFLSSLSVILLLISGLPLKHKVFMWTWTVIMWVSISAIAYAYTISLASMSIWTTYSFGFSIVVAAWFDIMALLFIVHTIRFLVHRTQDWSFKNKCLVWLSTVIVWIIAASMKILPVPPINPIHRNNFLFDIFEAGWMVFAAILIVLHAIQLVIFIPKISETLFKKFKSQVSSINQQTNNV